MSVGFVMLGGVLIAFSLLVALVVIARTWPRFETDQADARLRRVHYLAYLRSEWRLRPAWKAIRYPGVTGLVWLLAGWLLGWLPSALLQAPFFTNLVVPVLTYGPVLALFFYDQVTSRRKS